MSQHIDARVAELALGGLRPALKELVDHLLSCEPCRGALAALERPVREAEAGSGEEYEPIFLRLDRRLAAAELRKMRERARCLRELDMLLAAPPAERRRLVRERRTGLPLELAGAVLGRARSLGPSDPAGTRDLAELALEILGRQEAKSPSEERRIEALTGQARAVLGLALAVEGRWPQAAEAFDAASLVLGESATLEEEAGYCTLRGWSAQAAGYSIEAAAYFGRAAELYGREGSAGTAAARALVARASVELSQGEVETALATVAGAVLDASDDQRASARARRVLAWVLLVDRRWGDAEEVLRGDAGGAVDALTFYQILKAHLLGKGGAVREAATSATQALEPAEAVRDWSLGFGPALLLAALHLETGGSGLLAGRVADACREAAGSQGLSRRGRQALRELADRVEARTLDLPRLVAAARILAEESFETDAEEERRATRKRKGEESR